MFLLRKISNDTDSRLSAAMSATNDTLVCVVSCDSPNKEKISQQLRAYTQSIKKKIMFEKQEKDEPLTKTLTRENYPEDFYDFNVEKISSFLGISNSSYKIKIFGTPKSLQSAIEALVFAGFYSKESCLLPPSLDEYAEQLLQGNIPPIITKIALNF